MSKEIKVPDYIDFPYDVFLMLRLEFLAICQDELEAKIMRIIEKAITEEWERIYRERCGTTPKDQEVQMPEEVWVAIPMRFFMDRLLGTVQSETTLKDALNKSLIDKKKLVFRKDRTGKYEAPLYTLNRTAIVEAFKKLPSDPRKLDILTLMKRPRKNNKSENNNPGDQLLTPSGIDPMKNDGTNFRSHQLLTPMGTIIDPMPERGGDQLLTPTNMYYLDDNLDNNNVDVAPQIDATLSHEEQIAQAIALLQANGLVVTPSESSTPDVQPASSQPEQPAPEQQTSSVSYSPLQDEQKQDTTSKGKGRGKGKKPTLELVPVPPPARPSEDMPWSPEKMLAWGDYARQSTLPVIKRRDSKYFKACEAASKSFGRGITENAFLLIFFNWMKGIDLELNPLPNGAIKSDTWPDYPVDLWVFDEHYEDEARKYKKAKGTQTTLVGQREQAEKQAALQASAIARGKPFVPPPTDLEKYGREMEAKYAKKARA
jgi:hypothetical protein